jgi:hypothetical protein
MNVNQQTQPRIEDLIASALNEQGYLFAQVVREEFLNRPHGSQHQDEWKWVTMEYAVTAGDGSQTRIDHVLQRGNCHLIMECKRANPAFKKWVFFDRVSERQMFVETAQCIRYNSEIKSPTHGITSFTNFNGCPVFNYYLEVAAERPSGNNRGNQRWSASDTIENAFQQVVKGQSGLMAKSLSFRDTVSFQAIPVVVTTAELYAVDYDIKKVSLRDGTLDADVLKASLLDFCAVNFHGNDNLSAKSKWNSEEPWNLQHDVSRFQMRTVFVVRARALNQFLCQAANWVKEIL